MDVKVSLDVYKALTARLAHETQSYDDVIRELLQLDSITEPEPPAHPFEALADVFARPLGGSGGFVSRGLWLPNGTKLRARYKGRLHLAQIADDAWVDESGEQRSSPSAAAAHITGTTVNGLRFWEAMRPGENGWRRLEALRP